ncbi:TetR/AcrR family transcriptional regulator [uncultured Acinetobacter sp.]|uniref:TetR/AcrR family transcriptional regulator n=1 Tax=uncultured Acinetobacter sp. TaxID=165433 RepID=UPI00261E84D1|nr:TetR/AcrR family transcriptional regulator [uncultured Acinetobacter sp.]
MELEKTSRRQLCILAAVAEALAEHDYAQLTIEDVASRAGVGKSTIYRWWKHKSDLVLDCFKQHTASVFELDFEQSLTSNLEQQLTKLTHALQHPIGRALLAVMAQNRETAGEFFQQYLLPRREQTRELIQLAIQRGEIRGDYPFELMLDTLYAPIHYQILFFNTVPHQHYIKQLVALVLAPLHIEQGQPHA